jgi:Na+-driven multidrug efflux pump
MNINAIPVASVQTAAPALNPKIRSLVEGPILTTLLKLAAPNFADATARVTFLTLDAYFVSFLGGDALAGVALVFPFFLLMQTMATAAMGGGVSSAVARALGAGKQDDANALVWHGAAIALGMSAAFLIIFAFARPALYSAMGAKGKVLDGLVYAFMGIGSGLFYASQGLGSVSGSFLAQTAQLALLVIVGWMAMPMFGLGLRGLFIATAATIAWVGIAIMLVFWRRSRELTR